MALSRDQIHTLVREVSETCVEEFSCECCMAEIGSYVERLSANENLCETLRAVKAHVAVCVECREMFETLRIALSALDALGNHEEPCPD